MERFRIADWNNNRSARLCGLLAAGALTYAFVQNAWVVDDAYITFRTVDNLLHGYGLTWNVGERVQAFTHPLWMFGMAAAAALTREYFYTSLALSFLCSAGALLLAWRHLARRGVWRACMFAALVLTSKSVIDYSSSGLENPLSYLLLILFFSLYFRRASRQPPDHATGTLVFLAALAYLNRQDTVLVYLPALLDVLTREWHAVRFRLARTVAVATLPATMWSIFALFYYGFLFPNTAYAKLSGTDLPLSQRLQHGIDYLGLSLQWDALGFVLLAVAGLIAARRRDSTRSIALAGACLYLAYVLVAGAGATHMIGRFVALPLLLVFFAAADGCDPADLPSAVVPVPLIVAYAIANPVSPLKQNTRWYKTETRSVAGYIDTAWFAKREGTGLLTYRKVPNVCLDDGFLFRASAEPLRVGGCGGTDPIGFFGFAAGPGKWVIDRLALSDAFLARLRPCVDFRTVSWKPGHFPREIPAGYLDSVLTGTDLLQDAGLHEYYAVLSPVVRGSLWSGRRLRLIALLNLGRYDYLLDDYNRGVARRARMRGCQF